MMNRSTKTGSVAQKVPRLARKPCYREHATFQEHGLQATRGTLPRKHYPLFTRNFELRVRHPAPALTRAFTLIELLLVMAIVGLLFALLIPAILSALGAADSFRCQSRLHQISLAYQQYTGDSGGLWPPIMTTTEAPADLLRRIEADTGLKRAPARPDVDWGQPGPHWSIVLWPYLGSFDLVTCPADPKSGRRGKDVVAAGAEHQAALLGAPPESYALNVILFRTQDDWRQRAGCTWGLHGDADYNGLTRTTTLAEQRQMFPALPRRILFFCGASGQTIGSQFNVPWRTSGLVERWAWHWRRASAPFVDEPGCGSNYLFADGRVEYRETMPDLVEWGYDLGRTP
jgi:prepilin-type N-terminal cleavage/methylation domain-containing protein/prepilin-type processing-associated H-X9-DG protein